MEIINIIEKLNWQTMIGVFGVVWYFTYDIRKTLEKLEVDVKAQGARTDRLYEMFIELLKHNSK
jgi:hypothetical protein